MDTSTAPPSKQNMRADITRQYEEPIVATTELMDPNRAKARKILKDEEFEVEEVAGAFSAPAHHANDTRTSYLEAPLLTLRELMPGSTSEGDEGGELDQSFRADKIEFMVIQRPTPEEVQADSVLEDAGHVDWSIPTQSEYEDLMGQVMDVYTDTDSYLVDALNWSSVGSTTGVRCFP